jgi:hypothetical protein
MSQKRKPLESPSLPFVEGRGQHLCWTDTELTAAAAAPHPALASNCSCSLLRLQRRQLLPSPAAATAPTVAFTSSSALSHLQQLQLLPCAAAALVPSLAVSGNNPRSSSACSTALSHLQHLQLLLSTADVHALTLALNISGLCSCALRPAVALGLVFSSSSTRSCQLQQPQLSPWLAATAALAFAYSGRILCSLYC